MISNILNTVTLELFSQLSRIITGKLLTESQIQGITKHVVGRYFADLFPQPQRELEAEHRVAKAKLHITEASSIITDLQNDLEKQATQLDLLAKEIQEKKETAERYSILAQTNQESLAAFKTELEQTVRKELVAQAESGKRVRRIVSFIFWFITLVLGAALGTYFQFRFEPFFKKQSSVPTSQPVNSSNQSLQQSSQTEPKP